MNLPEAPNRIECFDISHIQGTDKVASMVVWEDGRMKKADYRKFIIRTVVGNDDFASMREVITRRYGRLQEEKKPFPGLVLVDGGLGQLHAAAKALEELGITYQPLASIAKRDEWIYVYGQEDEPIILDKFSPILHLVQTIRDEAHRFAVTFHRTRRNAQRLTSELHEVPGDRSKNRREAAAYLWQSGAGEAEFEGRSEPRSWARRRLANYWITSSSDLTRSPFVQIETELQTAEKAS